MSLFNSLYGFFAVMAVSIGAFGFGPSGSGGGDLCEDRIQMIRDDIREWIGQGGHKGLVLPTGVTSDQYSTSILDKINRAKIKCVGFGDVGFPVNINGRPKTCRFDFDFLGNNQIVCDWKKFMAVDASEQYILIHHEYAALAGIEPPNNEDSNYDTSNQVSGYLTDQVVKKLAIHPVQSEDCSLEYEYNPGWQLLDYARNLRVTCVEQALRNAYVDSSVLETKDHNGRTPLHVVATAAVPQSCFGNKFPEICKSDYQARKAKVLAIAKLLVRAKANMENRDNSDDTPILTAATRYPDLAIFLAKSGASITAKENGGNTVIHFTTNLEVIDLYIKAHGDMNSYGFMGFTAVGMHVVDGANAEFMRIQDSTPYKKAISKLVKAGAWLNTGDPTAMGALRWLAKLHKTDPEKFEMYKFLKSLGAKD